MLTPCLEIVDAVAEVRWLYRRLRRYRRCLNGPSRRKNPYNTGDGKGKNDYHSHQIQQILHAFVHCLTPL